MNQPSLALDGKRWVITVRNLNINGLKIGKVKELAVEMGAVSVEAEARDMFKIFHDVYVTFYSKAEADEFVKAVDKQHLTSHLGLNKKVFDNVKGAV